MLIGLVLKLLDHPFELIQIDQDLRIGFLSLLQLFFGLVVLQRQAIILLLTMIKGKTTNSMIMEILRSVVTFLSLDLDTLNND